MSDKEIDRKNSDSDNDGGQDEDDDDIDLKDVMNEKDDSSSGHSEEESEKEEGKVSEEEKEEIVVAKTAAVEDVPAPEPVQKKGKEDETAEKNKIAKHEAVVALTKTLEAESTKRAMAKAKALEEAVVPAETKNRKKSISFTMRTILK